MAHPYPATSHQEQNVDDLMQIHGIGPAMKHKLNAAGIQTIIQLENMSTEELDHLFSHTPGWSAERARDLINQARDIAQKEAPTDHLTSDDTAQYSAQFSVDLLLDNQKRVRRTHIIHVQSGKEKPWADWDKDQLAGFILTNAKIKPDPMRGETVEFQFSPKNLPKDRQQASTKRMMGEVNISEAIIQASSGKPTHLLVTGGQPFDVRLILDMSKTLFSPETPLQYQAEIHIKNLANGEQQRIGEKKGILEARGLIPIVITCNALPQGSYRLQTSVMLTPDLEDPDAKSRLVALMEGKVFRVN